MPCITAAQAPDPQAKVSPTPLSTTRRLISFLMPTGPKLTSVEIEPGVLLFIYKKKTLLTKIKLPWKPIQIDWL